MTLASVSPFYLYKSFKSIYKKTKTDEEFISFIEEASNDVKFEESNGKSELIQLCKDVVEDAATMKAGELKSKWENTAVPAYGDYDHIFAALGSTLTTSTGGTGWRWNLYDREDTSGYTDKYGQVVIGTGMELNKTYLLVDNDKLGNLGTFIPDEEFENIGELKSILKYIGYSTFNKAYAKSSGKTSTNIFSLKPLLHLLNTQNMQNDF